MSRLKVMVDANAASRGNRGWPCKVFRQDIYQNFKMRWSGDSRWVLRFWLLEWDTWRWHSLTVIPERGSGTRNTWQKWPWTQRWYGMQWGSRSGGSSVGRSREVFAKKNVVPLWFPKACCIFRTRWQVLFFVLIYVWIAKVWQSMTGNSWCFSFDYHSCLLEQVVEIF